MNPLRTTGWTIWAAALLAVAPAGPAAARTSNGNDFALYYAEARTDAERAEVFQEAKGRPHFFRYLQILEMQETTAQGRTAVDITAFEPASRMDVRFTVSMTESLRILKEAPVSAPGGALAVSGKVVSVDDAQNAILLDPVIVRYKDRLSPKIGKELLCEVDPGAVFYSYTGGKRPVNLSMRDRDLLRRETEILEKEGPAGWAAYLERELAKRRTPGDRRP